MSIKRIALIVVLLATVAGLSTGYYLFNKKVPSLENTQADFELTANELFDAFNDDELASMLKYEGKVIAVSGQVSSIKVSDSTSNVTLHADNALIGGINCSFNARVSDLKEGDEVTIKGRCQGILMDVILNNCVK